MTKKKKISELDAFVLLGAVLILIGMLGQSVSVRLYDRWQRSEQFEVSFTVRSCSKQDAQALIEKREGGGAVSCYTDEKSVGYLVSAKLKELPGAEGGETVHQTLCDLTGTAMLYGREKDGRVILYGLGETSEGDIVLLSLEKRVFALEITSLNVKKNEKPT